MDAFVEILHALLSSDNALRSSAEKRYESSKKEQPAATVEALFRCLSAQQLDLPVREQAAVLLRQCLSKTKEPESVWSRLGGEPAQAKVRAQLLQVLEFEPHDKVRRKAADCIQSLANQLIDIDEVKRPQNCQEWPELMPGLMRLICDSSRDAGMRADALWIVKEAVCSMWQVLVASAGQTAQVVKACLADPADAVKANAACMLCELVAQLETKEDRQQFGPFVPELFAVISQLASAADSKHLQAVLSSLSTTEEVADFFRECLSSHTMPVLCRIAKSHRENDARKLALEVLIAIAEGKPKMVLKAAGCVEAMLEVIVHFLMELSDDVEQWAATDEDGAEAEENYVFGQEAINRLAAATRGAESFAPVLVLLRPALMMLFERPDWKGHVASLVILAQTCEYIDDEATVDQLLRVLKAQLHSPHVRARYCAWGALNRFAQNQMEVLEGDAWAAELVPEFIAGLDDSSVRVVLACMKAFHQYGEGIERDNLEPFVPALMERLGSKLQGVSNVQRESITCIAVIAGQIEDGFAQYYGPLMPMLKQVISATLHKSEERVLLGKTFECISLLANAVGRERFRPDAEVILQAMMQACSVPDLPKDDPVQEYVMAAAERLCSTLREDFLPFVPHILPGVLGKFHLSPKEYVSGRDAIDDQEEVSLSIVPGENGKVKIMVMSTSEVEELQHALECVHAFVDTLGRLYGPFIRQTAQALLPVFDFSVREDVRDLAFETWGQLCGCARDAEQQVVLAELCQELMRRILPKLEKHDGDIEALKTRIDGIKACLESAGPGILSAEQVRHICQVTLNLISESLRRRESNVKAPASKTADDEDTRSADRGLEEDALRAAACGLAITVMQHHPDHFVSEGLPLYLPPIQRLLQLGACDDDQWLALLVASGFCEHLGARATAHWPSFLPQVLERMQHKNSELRTMACYVASMAAALPDFAPHARAAAQAAAEVVVQTRGRGKAKSEKPAQKAADNALSALVEMLLHQQPALAETAGQLWSAWLAGLPCQEDEAEGLRNNRLLLTLVQQQNPAVVGEGGQNVSRLVLLLSEAYRTDMADDVTSFGIGRLFLGMEEARLEHYSAAFTEKQCKKLLRIRREAQGS